MRFYFLAVAGVSLFVCNAEVLAESANLDTYPRFGTLAGLVDRDFMTFECEEPAGNRIKCSFTQVKLRKKADPEKLAKRLEQIPQLQKAYRDNEHIIKDCDSMKTWIPNLLKHLREGAKPSELNEKDRERLNWALAL